MSVGSPELVYGRQDPNAVEGVVCRCRRVRVRHLAVTFSVNDGDEVRRAGLLNASIALHSR